MQAIISPGNIRGRFMAPPSKSHTQRAYAAALLHKGTTVIHNPGKSDDELAALDIIQTLGANVNRKNSSLHIYSTGVHPVNNVINCHESGLAARLFTPIAALSEARMMVNGTGSLLKRPMTGLQEMCTQLNMRLENFNGYLPFFISGQLQPANIKMDGSAGSQLLSGLLMALTACAENPVVVEVENLKSIPYVEMTLDILSQFGKPISHDNHQRFFIEPAAFTNITEPGIAIEGDWSGAAFFLAGAAIAGEVMIDNLDISSRQADKAIVSVLKQAGALITINEKTVSVHEAPLAAFRYDATHSPDLFPILAILAACCKGESGITGLHRLVNKESNRAKSIAAMLTNFGVPFSITGDTLFITGVHQLRSCSIDSFSDHRIAMATVIGAARANGLVTILNADAVAKSYPAFYTHLQQCGVSCILA